ncbi:MAG: hypothetical protein Q8916_09275 [Bacteroidota bacterium]|nr:hypothetical protein [Bacteroidota bacterium]MDP4230578.1 hypothetical protein [Bacteroidota bacterium]
MANYKVEIYTSPQFPDTAAVKITWTATTLPPPTLQVQVKSSTGNKTYYWGGFLGTTENSLGTVSNYPTNSDSAKFDFSFGVPAKPVFFVPRYATPAGITSNTFNYYALITIAQDGLSATCSNSNDPGSGIVIIVMGGGGGPE